MTRSALVLGDRGFDVTKPSVEIEPLPVSKTTQDTNSISTSREFRDLNTILKFSQPEFSLESIVCTDKKSETDIAQYKIQKNSTKVNIYKREFDENNNIVLAFYHQYVQLTVYEYGMVIFCYKKHDCAQNIKSVLINLFLSLTHPHLLFALENIIELVDPDSEMETQNFEEYNAKMLMKKFPHKMFYYSTKLIKAGNKDICVKGYWFTSEANTYVAIDPCTWKEYYQVVAIDNKQFTLLYSLTLPIDKIGEYTVKQQN